MWAFYSNRVEQFVPAGGKKGCLLQKGYLSFTITLGILKKMVRILLWGSVCAVLASVQRDKAKVEGMLLRG